MGDSGTSTVEYALVLIAAAAMALTLLAWVLETDLLAAFFNAVMRRIISGVGGGV